METEYSRENRLGKYFLHGIAFSGLMVVLIFVWLLMTFALILSGYLIGLILGVAALFFIVGALNAFLANLIWSIPIKTRILSLFAHGLVLLLVLAIAAVPSLVINLVAPSIITPIVIFVVYCFIDGYLAKHVAGMWEDEESYEEGSEES